MEFRKVSEQIVHHGCGSFNHEVRVCQVAVLEPSDDDHPTPVLEHSEVLRILLMALDFVSDAPEVLLKVLPDGATLGGFNAGHVLEDEHARLIFPEESCVELVQVVARVFLHRSLHVAALCSANEGVCLARRAADDYVYLLDAVYLHDAVDGLEDGGEGFIGKRLVDDSLCDGGGDLFHELVAADLPGEVFPVEGEVARILQIVVCAAGFERLRGVLVHLDVRYRPEACLEESFGQTSGSREEVYEIVGVLLIRLWHTSSSQSSPLNSIRHGRSVHPAHGRASV